MPLFENMSHYKIVDRGELRSTRSWTPCLVKSNTTNGSPDSYNNTRPSIAGMDAPPGAGGLSASDLSRSDSCEDSAGPCPSTAGLRGATLVPVDQRRPAGGQMSHWVSGGGRGRDGAPTSAICARSVTVPACPRSPLGAGRLTRLLLPPSSSWAVSFSAACHFIPARCCPLPASVIRPLDIFFPGRGRRRQIGTAALVSRPACFFFCGESSIHWYVYG